MSEIYFLKNSEIDRQKRAATLAKCPNRQIFAEDWFLDIVSPDWGDFVRGDYEVFFPLPIKKKLGFSYLVQPEFTAQLGLFSTKEGTQNCDDFLKAVQRKYRRYHFNLNTENVLEKHAGFPMINCQLNLNKSYEELYSSFSKGTKRNIKKALKTEEFEIKKCSFDEFFYFKMKSLTAPPPADYEKLKALNSAFIQNNIIVNCLSYFHKNELLASAMLVEYHNRIYYFNGASSPEGKKLLAMFAIFDFFIKQEADSNRILDFKGGQMPGTKRFFTGFGAEEKQYLRIVRKF